MGNTKFWFLVFAVLLFSLDTLAIAGHGRSGRRGGSDYDYRDSDNGRDRDDDDGNDRRDSNDQGRSRALVVRNGGGILLPGNVGRETKKEGLVTSSRLDNLSQFLKSRIIGQDRIMDILAEGANAKFGPQGLNQDKPLTYFLIGATGIGKSATGEALAEGLFGDKSFLASFDLGAASGANKGTALWTVLGSPKGYVGSSEKGQLERALEKLPKGGVLVFEEASNLGAGDPEKKAEAFRQLLSLIETGKFVSDATGKSFDLRNYVILFNGNDGQKLFAGTSSEAKRLDIYEAYSGTEKAKDILVESGVPREFLRRLNDVALYRPITEIDAAKIVEERFLAPTLKSIQSSYGDKVMVSYDERFLKTITHFFVSQDYGVTPARDFIQDRLSNLINRIIKERLKISSTGMLHLQMEISDTLQGDPSSDPYQRKIGVSFKDVTENSNQATNIDITNQIRTDRILGLDADSPVDSPALRGVLSRFQDRLRSRLFGQNEAVDAITAAVRSYYYNRGARTRPISIFMVGSTGTGKTHFGKSTAYALFDNENQSATVSLGGVTDAPSLDRFLGRGVAAEPGKKSEFEQAVEKLRNGGVLILDEASNMGGNSPSLKNILFKKFYDLLEEGKYTSETTGITYDLSNVVFLFTGNDGERLFEGAFNDDTALSVWQSHRSRESVARILEESGVPKAFLGRIETLLLARPLIETDLTEIAKTRFLDDYLKEFGQKNHVKVAYDPEFLRQLVRTFFDANEGARSLRPVVQNLVGGALAQAVEKHMSDGGRLDTASPLTLQLSLRDTLTLKPYTLARKNDRKVTLSVTVAGADQALVSADYTGAAPVVPVMGREQAIATAFHEAGHAVVNDPKLTGMSLEFITARGRGSILGYARYETQPQAANPTRERLVASLARAMGGQIASMMAGHDKEVGWSSDLGQMRRSINNYLINSGMDGRLVVTRLDKAGRPLLDKYQLQAFRHEGDRILLEAFQFTSQRLQQHWPLIRAVATELLTKGTVSAQRFTELQNQFAEGKLTHYEIKLGEDGTAIRGGTAPSSAYYRVIRPEALLDVRSADCCGDALAQLAPKK